MKYWIYVDYLNFFWRVSVHYGVYWIDFEKLIIRLLRKKFPDAEIGRLNIYYSMLSGDPAKSQELHLNALQHHSQCINLVQGHHKTVYVTGKIKKPEEIRGIKATVKSREEKHTDMNMGCQILYDAIFKSDIFKNQVLVTNDSDFATPLSFTKGFKQDSILIAPIPVASKNFKPASVAKDLRKFTLIENRILEITLQDLLECLLPDQVGKYKKPSDDSWLID